MGITTNSIKGGCPNVSPPDLEHLAWSTWPGAGTVLSEDIDLLRCVFPEQ